MNFIVVENDGPEILSTNYWGLAEAKAGKLLVSINAGAFRVLVPPSSESAITDMATATQCVVSRGPWPGQGLADAVEILFDDGTNDPFALHLAVESFDRLPLAEDVGDKWVLSVWTKGSVKRMERLCAYRLVPRLPWLKPWKGS